MGKHQRDKGARAERQLAAYLRDHGWDQARRGAQHRGGPDSPDVVGVPGLHIEVKASKRQCRPWDWLEQARREAPEGSLPVVFWRRDRFPWLVLVEGDRFMEMVREYVEAR